MGGPHIASELLFVADGFIIKKKWLIWRWIASNEELKPIQNGWQAKNPTKNKLLSALRWPIAVSLSFWIILALCPLSSCKPGLAWQVDLHKARDRWTGRCPDPECSTTCAPWGLQSIWSICHHASSVARVYAETQEQDWRGFQAIYWHITNLKRKLANLL